MPPGPGLQQHLHTPHPHDCYHCDSVFIEESELESHRAKEHSQQESETRKPSVEDEKGLNIWVEEKRSKENCEEKRVENCMKTKGGGEHVEENIQELENEEETRACRQHSEVEDITIKQSQEGSKEQIELKEEENRESSEEHSEENVEGGNWTPSEQENKAKETSEKGDVEREHREVEEDSITAKRKKHVIENIQKGVPIVSLKILRIV